MLSIQTKNPPAEADGSIVLCWEPDQNSIRMFIVARSARLMVSTDMMSTGTLNAWAHANRGGSLSVSSQVTIRLSSILWSGSSSFSHRTLISTLRLSGTGRSVLKFLRLSKHLFLPAQLINRQLQHARLGCLKVRQWFRWRECRWCTAEPLRWQLSQTSPCLGLSR